MLLRLQFHRGLEAIDIQAQRKVEFGELLRLRVLQPDGYSQLPGAHSLHFSVPEITDRFSEMGVPE